MLPFIGKRLIDWQLEELRQSPYVEALYLIGLAEEDAVFVPEDYERLEQFVKKAKCVDLRTKDEPRESISGNANYRVGKRLASDIQTSFVQF